MSEPTLAIHELGLQGDGVHPGSRGPVYVERTVPGDVVKARVRRDDEGVLRAEILEIVEPSPHRQSAPCPHYDRCGNCTLQHVAEPFYRDWKVALVTQALRRQGLRPPRPEPVFIGGRNRRRATFAVHKGKGGVLMGYYRRRSRRVSDIDSCLVADPRLLALRESLRPLLGEALKTGTTADVFVQLVGPGADVVVTGPVSKDGLEPIAALPAVTRVGWRGREGGAIEIVAAKGPLVAAFGPLNVALPPAAFLQPTPEGEAALVSAVREALPPEGRFADLFAGCGTFSGPLLARGEVDAYESAAPAVKALARAAGGLPLRAFRRDLFRRPLGRRELRYDAVVFDPPRAGCREQAAALAGSRVPVLVGVSCNPATFARDARILGEGGYRLRSLRIVDQFLWSHHVEVVGVFSRRRVDPGRRRS